MNFKTNHSISKLCPLNRPWVLYGILHVIWISEELRMINFQNFPYKYKANQSTTQLVYAVTHTTHVEYLHIPLGIARYKINIYIVW